MSESLQPRKEREKSSREDARDVEGTDVMPDGDEDGVGTETESTEM